MKFLRLSDKRADDNFRAGKTFGHEVTIDAKNVMASTGLKTGFGEYTNQRHTGMSGLKPEVKKFLRANGAFAWYVRKSNGSSIAVFRIAREDAAMMFKLTFS
jgi:hypothetical protein